MYVIEIGSLIVFQRRCINLGRSRVIGQRWLIDGASIYLLSDTPTKRLSAQSQRPLGHLTRFPTWRGPVRLDSITVLSQGAQGVAVCDARVT